MQLCQYLDLGTKWKSITGPLVPNTMLQCSQPSSIVTILMELSRENLGIVPSQKAADSAQYEILHQSCKEQCIVNNIEYIVEKETKCLIIIVVDVDLKDCEKGEKPKDENEEAKTKATMSPPGTRRSSKYGSGTSKLTRCCTSELGTCNHLSSLFTKQVDSCPAVSRY